MFGTYYEPITVYLTLLILLAILGGGIFTDFAVEENEAQRGLTIFCRSHSQ